jgi:hypothetical protein
MEYRVIAGRRLSVFARPEFLRYRWSYNGKDLVFFSQRTQRGKTHWMFQLLQASRFDKPPVYLCMKAVDPVPAEWARRLDWEETPEWPPNRAPWRSEPPGYLLWPRHDLSMSADALERTKKRQRENFSRVFLAARKGGQPVIADELYGLCSELDLNELVIESLTRGSGARSPLWYALQKPSGTQAGGSIPGHALNSWTHGFFGKDADLRNQRRISELSADLPPEVVTEAVGKLRVHKVATPRGTENISEQLYLNSNTGQACIIGAVLRDAARATLNLRLRVTLRACPMTPRAGSRTPLTCTWRPSGGTRSAAGSPSASRTAPPTARCTAAARTPWRRRAPATTTGGTGRSPPTACRSGRPGTASSGPGDAGRPA